MQGVPRQHAWQAVSARAAAAAWLSRPLRNRLSVCASPSAKRSLASCAASAAAYLQASRTPKKELMAVWS